MFHLNFFAALRRKTQNLFGVIKKSHGPKRQFVVTWVPRSIPRTWGLIKSYFHLGMVT